MARADAQARKESGAGTLLPTPVAVNPENLGPNVSYGIPDFVTRGYYVSQPFTCKDCGRAEVWSARQQKWWYEIAKGDLWTTAVRCRPCRRRERDRRKASRGGTAR